MSPVGDGDACNGSGPTSPREHTIQGFGRHVLMRLPIFIYWLARTLLWLISFDGNWMKEHYPPTPLSRFDLILVDEESQMQSCH